MKKEKSDWSRGYGEGWETGRAELIEDSKVDERMIDMIRKDAKKEVFDIIDIIIGYEPSEYRLRRYNEEKLRK